MDCEILSTLNRQIDDVGFFDSIMLARPYRAVLDLSDLSPTSNIQCLDGARMSVRALAATATNSIDVCPARRPVSCQATTAPNIDPVPSPTPAYRFCRSASHLFGRKRNPPATSRPERGSGAIDHASPRRRHPCAASPHRRKDTSSMYDDRPSCDVIVVKVQTDQTGLFLRVIESFDLGGVLRSMECPHACYPPMVSRSPSALSPVSMRFV